MVSKGFAGAFALAMLLGAPCAEAYTKLDEGFASVANGRGGSGRQRGRATRAKVGDDVYYWIEWKEAIPRAKLRCVVKGPGTDIDETESYSDPDEGGFTACLLDTEDAKAGLYQFTQYLDGELAGQRSITVEEDSFFGKLSLRRQWKYGLGILAAVILGVYWLRRRMTGDKRSLSDVLGGEAREDAMVREASSVVIGSKLAPVSNAPAPKPDPGPDLKKMATQLEYYLQQPDKSQGLDIGRRFITELIKAGDMAGAVKAVKQCAAADPSFRLAEAGQVLPLAKAARAAGDPQGAVAVVRGFDKAFPGDAAIPEVFVFSARLLEEDLGNKDMARKILAHVVQRYPGHYLSQEARRDLERLAT